MGSESCENLASKSLKPAQNLNPRKFSIEEFPKFATDVIRHVFQPLNIFNLANKKGNQSHDLGSANSSFHTQTWVSSSKPPCSDVLLLNSSSTGNDDSSSNTGDKSSTPFSSPGRSATSSVRIHGIDSATKRGPAFVGQVFTLFDLTHMRFKDIRIRKKFPFLHGAPQWMKNILDSTNRAGHPIFRFFTEFDDAVKYMQQMRIPSGLLGTWHLAEAYEHFKENPQMFQFVPNQVQVREANKLLRRNFKQKHARKLKGVPVFTARNLRIAVATSNGIRWFMPYFFDKRLLDNILEGTVDQHFQSLIQNRRLQRRREMGNDDFPMDVFEEHIDNFLDPPEVQEIIEEMDVDDIPFDLISKAAGIYFCDLVDDVLLGNRWIRKAIGIQPKFPYMVDSFEERTASAISRANEQTSRREGDSNFQVGKEHSDVNETMTSVGTLVSLENTGSRSMLEESRHLENVKKQVSSIPDLRKPSPDQSPEENIVDRILPKITMIGFSMTDPSRTDMALIKKSIAELAKEIERNHKRFDQEDDNDPLFFTNILDFPVVGSSKSAATEDRG
eukprot:TRINITY_DN23178_c0_g1_i1.p1 TRINITY_DN23178_c0_g1~~TRINITY_DN23178_c0_g1_i1.p1  ORF type:complete len:558 (-),score=117.76 TRINITY_DN23178_c0_g1_i1:199-1872(-)